MMEVFSFEFLQFTVAIWVTLGALDFIRDFILVGISVAMKGDKK